VCFFVLYAAMVINFYILIKYNLFGYNDTGKLVMPASALQYIRDHKEKDMAAKKGKGHH
jgi:hypothetical protein